MLKKISLILALITVVLGIYIIIGENFLLVPYQNILLAAYLFVRGFDSLKRDKKNDGLTNIVAALAFLALAIFILITR